MTPTGSDPVGDDLRTFYEDSFAALLSTSPEVAAEIGVVKIGRPPHTAGCLLRYLRRQAKRRRRSLCPTH